MEQNMGKQRVVNKAMSPAELVKALQAGSITIAQAQQMFNGVMPIGDYKGVAAIIDLDLLVVQPLVLAEQLHILGILDGREEDYDKQTLTIPNGAVEGATQRARLTVPTGEVWFISAVEITTPADAGGRAAANWRCSLWADRAATPDVDGQAFHDADLADAAGHTWDDEFGYWTTAIQLTNKIPLLRLPGGAVITFQVTNTLAKATGDMECTLSLYGFVGKQLVA